MWVEFDTDTAGFCQINLDNFLTYDMQQAELHVAEWWVMKNQCC